LYYSLRSYLFEKRDQTTSPEAVVPPPSTAPQESTTTPPVEQTKSTRPTKIQRRANSTSTSTGAPSTPSGNTSPTPAQVIPNPEEELKNTSPIRTRGTALKYSEEIMACLKASHQSLASDLEFVIKEISSSFQPESQQLFHDSLKILLDQCYEVSST
jgi:hypothetical protein